jgi:hypothetical protein
VEEEVEARTMAMVNGDSWPQRCARIRADGFIANVDAGGVAGGQWCH